MEVLLIDDHPLIQEILPAIVRKAFGSAAVHTATDLEQGFRIARRCRTLDLVLLDLGLPGCSGIDALRRFRDEHRDVKIVILSAETSRDTILESFGAGAVGYIPKTSKPDVIVSALRIVAAGEVYVPGEVLKPGKGDNILLSKRELEVLRLMLAGLSNREIAARLAIAETTAKQHVSAIYAALGAHTRAQAMASASRRGFGKLA